MSLLKTDWTNIQEVIEAVKSVSPLKESIDPLEMLRAGRVKEFNELRRKDPNFGADLFGARLSEADLSGANLIRANLSGAILIGTILDGVIVDENTKTKDVILVDERYANDNTKIKEALANLPDNFRRIVLRDNPNYRQIRESK